MRTGRFSELLKSHSSPSIVPKLGTPLSREGRYNEGPVRLDLVQEEFHVSCFCSEILNELLDQLLKIPPLSGGFPAIIPQLSAVATASLSVNAGLPALAAGISANVSASATANRVQSL